MLLIPIYQLSVAKLLVFIYFAKSISDNLLYLRWSSVHCSCSSQYFSLDNFTKDSAELTLSWKNLRDSEIHTACVGAYVL